MLIGILRNENPESVSKWLTACQAMNIDADVIDLTAHDAIERIMTKPYNLFLLRPPGGIERFKTLYDERLYLIYYILGKPVFPGFLECYIYENKRQLASFLQLKGIPHPKTEVFYNNNDAISYVIRTKLPIVSKTNIGAAGSGVKILKTHNEALSYIKLAFKGKGIRKRTGPNPQVGTPTSWLVKAFNNPSFFKKRLFQYHRTYSNTQKGYLIFQEYIPHLFEWRVVKIGESYFAYKKFKVGDKASGAKNIGYDNPSYDLLNFVRQIADENNILTAAFDIFENNKAFLVNEIQAIFGHVKNHILEVDGKPGRYLYKNNNWIFEEGTFNTNESYDLRLKTALKLYSEGKLFKGFIN